MRYVSRALLAGGLGLATAFLAACGGSSGLLSANQANMLTAELSQAQTDMSSGSCTSANTVLERFQTQIANLPASINSTLVSDLDEGAATVRTLASKRCDATIPSGPSTTTTPKPPPTTTHEDTTSTSTSTTDTQTGTTTTPPTTSTPTTSPATTTLGSGTTSTGGNGGATLPGPGSGGGDGDNGGGGGTGSGPGG